MRQNDLQTGAPRRVGGQARRSAYASRSHSPAGRTRAEGEEVTGMDEDLKLIRQIVASGGRKYTAGNIDRSRYDRLVDLAACRT